MMISKSIIALGVLLTVVFSFGMGQQAFAIINPVQDYATVSYNNATNQVNVDWDFNNLPPFTECLVKGDLTFHLDINNALPIEPNTSFMPLFYSMDSTTPVQLESIENSEQIAEEISCNGNVRIDLDDIMEHPLNEDLDPDLEMYITFILKRMMAGFQA